MIAAFDVHYKGDKAKAVCIVFQNWTDRVVARTYTEVLKGIQPYEPGAFYKRELPCILKLLDKADLGPLEAILVDGYVFLDDQGKKGLGACLFEALQGRIPVIGIAKTSFFHKKLLVHEVKRGRSERPLFITAIGVDPATASRHIASMSGGHRIPDLLKLLDNKTRE